MARRGKEALIQLVMTSLAKAGWTLERLTLAGQHPARFSMARDAEHRVVKLYIWNLSHGGRGRSQAEYRIQVTGVDQFEPEPDGQTLILGWDDDLGVFAGFDVGARLDRLGSSPSIQIQSGALKDASDVGGSAQAKRDGEYAVAIRPDRLDQYISHLAQAHAGDISSLLGEPKLDPADIEAGFAHLAESGVVFDFDRPGDAELRAEVRDRSEALLAALELDPDARDHIGGNFPPEPIDEDAGEVRQALRDIVHQTTEPVPDGQRLAKSGAFLTRVSQALKTARKEGQQLFEKGKDIAREHVATIVISTMIAGAKHVPDLLAALLHVLLKWLQLAAGLF